MKIETRPERFVISAAADRNRACVVTLDVPESFSWAWPNARKYGHGHAPHVTVCFVTAQELDSRQQARLVAALSDVCEGTKPFDLSLDVSKRLKSFPPREGQDEVALWWPTAQGTAELTALHTGIRKALADWNLPCEAHDSFVGHSTWAYVPARRALDPEYVRRQSLNAKLHLLETGCTADMTSPDSQLTWSVGSVTVSLPEADYAIPLGRETTRPA